jgi:hypothetical protein
MDTQSNSDSSQKQSTDTQDNRIAAATDSVNLGVSRSQVGNVNISTSDHGAVDSSFKFADSTVGKAFDFANSITAGAANTVAASGAQSTSIAKSAMQSVQDAYANSTASVADAYKNTSDTLAAAYTTAKAGEQKVMVAVGLVIVGIVALKAIGKA